MSLFLQILLVGGNPNAVIIPAEVRRYLKIKANEKIYMRFIKLTCQRVTHLLDKFPLLSTIVVVITTTYLEE